MIDFATNFVFVEHRHELFDDGFQEQLENMYRTTGAGLPPHAPAFLCMVLLLQGYVGASDAESVELAVVDLRWQMCLDCIGVEAAPFWQGALQLFRERMVAHDMDRILLERTVTLVRSGAVTEGEKRAVTKALRNTCRPYQGIVQQIPVPSPGGIYCMGTKVISVPVLGGLHHDYRIAA